ncbi:hypothetical protein A2697_04795 [Candidatus Curtissbacteria bacterium RIFCSPHIGHO2_01_FULL_41_44]|uniref:Ketose-bisphosphate aldolase n=1 Tax=Candidatus Curtissbacteria bacterium RIFCSPLOWO2_01_FULL_42_50 TaxID=1797730 RepID=A0A1F5H6B3_9BACT|nr:MAG: hypothetical protein A3C33_03890 [Candidatus Curtissbacteria bacterium RIFCSPHIGHO2_02_FULL_42_58]OGD94339.1 MAG: hypothetical protein A2697_04795 [Candidatus Curtissbacteria bacterium RIFCSPHIGHO2_01_FULL_41_44]OGD97241.1 MAG: hypothetical protein A3E71_04235 [Candidatus Curtissbacteria bacterium RIFCSPHIGHO2_12_FULL_42_33]OGD99712.1 MAG: hypothetical protein A3B54_05565 [Candidatus Curtissbacteria bacterium RIFCSPLOWO2_01_FULL_42_50]OGE02351.1 MAG: hypothetical protein A3G16_03950 [Ca
MTAREWFAKAKKEGFAIGAFNVDNLEIFKAICVAGKNKKSPVIVEFSPGEAGYFGLANILDLVTNAREEYHVPILLNLDHARKVEDCLAAINTSQVESVHLGGVMSLDKLGTATIRGDSQSMAGFGLIHFDGSDSEFEENVENTKKVVAAAHAKGLLVEGEIDKLSGASEVHSEQIDLETLKKSYTSPDQAARFVEETNVDIYAAVFGNVHGTFPNQPPLDFGLLAKIREVLPNTFLSLHGGSGIPADQVKEAIKVGKIVKVNVNTEIRLAYRDALTEKLGEQPNEYTMYKLMPEVILAVAAVVEAKIEVFGSANKLHTADSV